LETEATITVRNTPQHRRYEILDGDAVIGKAHYLPHDGPKGPERIFYHTTVSEDYAGQGLAARLVQESRTIPSRLESPSFRFAPTSGPGCGSTRTTSSARPLSGPSTWPP